MILQQSPERGPPGRALRDSRAASGAPRGLDARCVCVGGPGWFWPGGTGTLSGGSGLMYRMTLGVANQQGLGISAEGFGDF